MAARSFLEREHLSSTRVIGAGILCAFFVSGTSGLIHEIVWTRLLRHVMGNTTFSITTVLCAFMGGLALGSYLGGRIIDRRHDPLRVFAILEGTVAIYCVFLPWLIGIAEPLYRFIYQNTHTSFYVFSLIRFVFCGLLLLIPATFMGATLPVLTRFFVRSPSEIGWSVGALYGVNTFGAVVGAALAGFALIPFWGVTKTIYTACLLNAGVCATAFLMHSRLPKDDSEEAHRTAVFRKKINQLVEEQCESERERSSEQTTVDRSRLALIVLLVGYGLSGAAALVYEIAWTRVLVLLINSSVYSFTLILVAFILGLAMGSLLFVKFADRLRHPMLALAVMEIAIGLSALLVVPLFGKLPFFVTGLISYFHYSFWTLQLAQFALVLLIVLVPTMLMGAAFPLASRLFAQRSAAFGRSVGTVYGCNTLGSILGSFLGGFVLIPFLGIQNTIVVAVSINILIGCVLLAFSGALTRKRKVSIVAMMCIVLAVGITFLPPWDPSRMSFGPFIEARRLPKRVARSAAALEHVLRVERTIYYKEDIGATIAVREDHKGDRYIWVDGKPDASSSADLPTEVMSAHVPILLHPDPRKIFVLGLASGITLGSAGCHPVEQLDCAEISPAMVEACRLFDKFNYNILDDPRVRIINADGRNHLALSNEKYDIISSEPSNPWIAGIADLFTREFFELCAQRLNPNGIVCIWIEAYNIDRETFQSVVRTFQLIFENTMLWNPVETDFMLIGSKGPIEVDYHELSRRMADEQVARDLERVGIGSLPEFLAHMVMGRNSVARLAGDAPIHTDDNALLEFASPRTMISSRAKLALLGEIERYRESDLSFLTGLEDDVATLASIKKKVVRLIAAKSLAFREKPYRN